MMGGLGGGGGPMGSLGGCGGGPLGLRQDDILRSKSYQACKFSQVTKHQNVR